MSVIIGVHGIGQQFKGDTVIHSEWWPSLQGGLHLASYEFSDPAAFQCAFYGNLFRPRGTLAGTETTKPSDIGEPEIELLYTLWRTAAQTEPERVPAPEKYTDARTLAATPQIVQRALNALVKSSFCANIGQSFMLGNLRQVTRYFLEGGIRRSAIESVTRLLTPETRVVVGHSLGSVVAYEALCSVPNNVRSFVTIGSPLGMPNIIFDRLNPAPNASHIGRWPGKIQWWTNIADQGDIVANPKQLRPSFGEAVKDVFVSNGSDAHHGERYLTAVQTGQAIGQGLTCK